MKKAVLLFAVALIFSVASLTAQSAKNRLDSGKQLFDQGNYDDAIKELSEAIKLNPKLAEAYAYRSWAYGRINDNDKALSDANEAIRLNSKLGIGYFVRGRLQSDNDRAIADYTEAIKLDSKFAMAYNNRGLAYANKGDYDRAITDFTEVIKLDPKYVMAYFARGIAYSGKGDYNRAITDYTEAIKLDPKKAEVYYSRGSAYDEKRDYDRAIADYTQAIKLDPKYVNAYNNRGSAYDEKGDYDRAIADYTQAIKLDPKYVNAYINRGVAYGNKGDYDHAITDYNEALRIDPNNNVAKKNLEISQKQYANRYDPAQFIMVPSDFKPSDYEAIDLFKAVSNSKNLQRSSSKQDALLGQLRSAFVLGLGGDYILQYKSDLTFVRQNGTDITFSSDDKAITQEMSIDQRSGLQLGQKVRVYYTITRSPLTTWEVIAIERR